jgi:hypothetical protein
MPVQEKLPDAAPSDDSVRLVAAEIVPKLAVVAVETVSP